MVETPARVNTTHRRINWSSCSKTPASSLNRFGSH